MRKVQERQFGLGQAPIGEIDLDPKSRDDIPAVLKGLQLLCEERRSELWALLAAGVCPESDHRLGRPGMELWRILVLGALKQGLDCDASDAGPRRRLRRARVPSTRRWWTT